MRITLGSILEKVKEWVSLLFLSDHEMCSFPFRYSFLSSIPVNPEGQGDDGVVYHCATLSIDTHVDSLAADSQ
jgi:hypothetical protein